MFICLHIENLHICHRLFFSSILFLLNCTIEFTLHAVFNRTEQVNGYSAFIDATTVYADNKNSEQHKKCR